MSNSLMDRLSKAGSIKVTTLEDSSFFNEKDMIPTNIPIINIALSGKLDGGITSGLNIIAGESKRFKSLLGLLQVKAYLKQYTDAICIFYDSGYGITPEYVKSMGVPTDRVMHVPLEHIEQLKFDMSKRLDAINRGDKVIFFLDSLGNLASKKEVEDALDEKAVSDMTRAKQIKSFFRIITPHLTTKNLTCIVVNHVYKEQGCLAGETKVKTANGNKNIGDIKVGDLVYSVSGLKPVTWTYSPDDLDIEGKKFMRLTFNDGSFVDCTDNHKFLLNDMTWKPAGEMVVGEVFK
jgi:RecA/RadA recombinase